MVNLSGGIGKIVSVLEKNADLLGGFYGFIEDPIYGGRGLEGAIPFMIERLKQWKIPNPEHILWYLQNHEAYAAFRNGIKAGIAGWLIESIGGSFHPMVKRVGVVLKKVGTGAAIGSGVGAILWLPAINPHGESGYNLPNPPSYYIRGAYSERTMQTSPQMRVGVST